MNRSEVGIDLQQHNLQQIGRIFRIELGIATERDNESAPSLAMPSRVSHAKMYQRRDATRITDRYTPIVPTKTV